MPPEISHEISESQLIGSHTAITPLLNTCSKEKFTSLTLIYLWPILTIPLIANPIACVLCGVLYNTIMHNLDDVFVIISLKCCVSKL